MGQSLDKLTIRGFKSIRKLDEFELKKLNVVIGANGAGKSNLVDFFRLVSAMMKTDGLKEFVAGNADTYLYGGPKHTKSITVRMSFGEYGYGFDLAPTQDGFFLVNNEQCHYGNIDQSSAETIGSGNFNPQLITEVPFNEQSDSEMIYYLMAHAYNAICSWRIYHFHDTSVESGMRRYQERNHSETLHVDAANIAPYLFKLKQSNPVSYHEIRDAVRLVIPFFDDFILEPNSNDQLRLDWRQKGLKDYPMRPTQLSDGSIRFVCLATALLQPHLPSTVIIDEPELGLHPSAIPLLSELIISAANRAQIVVATQSPALIDQFGVDDIVVANRKDGATVFERLMEQDLTSWLEEYSLGDLWSKNVIQGGPVYE